MKLIFIVLVICAACFFILLLIGRKGEDTSPAPGSFNDLPACFDAFLASDHDGAFLVVKLADREDFIQFMVTEAGVEIDFPVVTERQRTFERKIRSVCEEMGLAVVVNDDNFIDVYIDRSPDEIAETVTVLFERIYGASRNDRLEFVTEGFDLNQS